MKTLRFIGIVLLTVLMSVVISSCSKSDDDNNKGSGDIPVTTNKYLMKTSLTSGKGEVFLEKTYIYDSNTRISRINATSKIANLSADSYSYSYGDNSIEVNGVTYNIQNGHITSTSNGVTFTYDNDGYLTSASKDGNTITYTWSGGNLSNISYKRSTGTEELESVSYEYTNLAYPQNYPYCPEVMDYSHEEIMVFPPLLGYWGKTNKNLPQKYVLKSRGTVRESNNYDYTMEDGYPSIITSTDSRGAVSTITCQWK